MCDVFWCIFGVQNGYDCNVWTYLQITLLCAEKFTWSSKASFSFCFIFHITMSLFPLIDFFLWGIWFSVHICHNLKNLSWIHFILISKGSCIKGARGATQVHMVNTRDILDTFKDSFFIFYFYFTSFKWLIFSIYYLF